MSIFSKLITSVFGRKSDKDLKILEPIVQQINEKYNSLADLSDADIKKHFKSIKNNLLEIIDSNKAELKKSQKLNDEQIDNKLYQIEKEFLDQHMVDVFAIVKDVARRLSGTTYQVMGQNVSWDMVHYDVQLVGGIVLHQGKVAEMKTGEGKTLVSTLAIVLNALTGRGVHVITVNDYLAERDSQWMGLLYDFLGLTIGCVLSQMDTLERKEMYARDITYGTNSQFGFDYLRDNMSITKDKQTQRNHVFAIVDEVDSVLIDEARMPLIISGLVNNQRNEQYTTWKNTIQNLIKEQSLMINADLANIEQLIEDKNADAGKILLKAHRGSPKNKKLNKLFQKTGIKQLLSKSESEYIRDKKMHEIDDTLYFSIDERTNVVDLSEKGRNYLSPDEPNSFVIPDLGELFHKLDKSDKNEKDIIVEKEKLQSQHSQVSEKIHTINQLLRAFSLFEKDVEYIVQDGKVLIVDQHTGRIMHGRQFSDGMHQAIEAKESVTIQRETQTVATITIQNYFRMYEKLAGMTGTAITEASELMSIYNLDVIEIPTNKPLTRIDHEDRIYKTKREKFSAVIEKIKELNMKGQPVLVGTVSVEESETLSRMMRKTGMPHNILNAKQHQKEAEIITRAGHEGAITISTNMAGRGTDIKLASNVKELGGLFILGTGRHESRRIDLQLRGRSGRQGDNGESVFYLSLEDNLMRIFGSDRISKVMDRLGLKEGEVITHSMVTKSIERAQKKIEAMNFGSRKNLIEYDNVMNSQREIVYNRRNYALHEDDISNELNQITQEYIEDCINKYCQGMKENWELDEYKFELLDVFGIDMKIEDISDINILKEETINTVNAIVQFKNDNFDKESFNNFQKYVILRTIDEQWQDHLYTMDQLREGIGLRAYGQKNPLIEYKQEGFAMFEEMMVETNKETLKRIFRTDLTKITQSAMQVKENTKNLKTTTGDNVLSALSQPSSSNKISENNQMPGVSQNPQTFTPGAKAQPIKVDKKIGRNQECPCGSGKKYKKCHGAA